MGLVQYMLVLFIGAIFLAVLWLGTGLLEMPHALRVIIVLLGLVGLIAYLATRSFPGKPLI